MLKSTVLRDDAALDAAFSDSNTRPVLLFKHSLICGVSMAAMEELRDYLADQPEDAALRCNIIEIQNSRPLSDAIAERTGVRHQSPQALLLRDGKVAWSKTHYSITKKSLDEAVLANV
jgi:bacillithiol system protein YtxJ